MPEDPSVQYLKEYVAGPLRDAFAALVKAQPADGVDFLANHLRQSSAAMELRERQAVEVG